jgi:phosphatidylglycerol:prolipoprotein diacylglycerol transferase
MEFRPEYIVLFDRLQIRYYGIIIVAAMLVGAWVAARLAKRDGRDPDHIWGALTWAIIPAIVLARLWFVFFPPSSVVEKGMDTAWFLAHFFDLQNGLIGAYFYLRRNHQPIAPWLDIGAVALPLSQAIGRWANYVNQELYGTVTTLPWGIPIDRAHRVGEYLNTTVYPTVNPTTLFHPLFLYEALWNVLAFIILLNLFSRSRHKLRYGDIALICVMQYSFIRFLLEFLRVEVAHIPGTSINSSQAATAILFVLAFAIYLYRSRSTPTVEEVQKRQPVASGKAA